MKSALDGYGYFAAYFIGVFMGALAIYGVMDRPWPDAPIDPPPDRRMVMDCMAEVGWEIADEEAPAPVQIEQSRAWCERFVRGE